MRSPPAAWLDGLLAGGRLDEVRPRQHATRLRGPRSQSGQLAGAEDHLEQRVAAGFPERPDLVVQRSQCPEAVRARDDHVDLAGARLDRGVDLLDPLANGSTPRKPVRDRATGSRRPDSGPRRPDERVMTHTAPTCSPKCATPRPRQVLAQGRRALAHSRSTLPRRVVTLEGGEVDAGDRSQQPGGLPLFLTVRPWGSWPRRRSTHCGSPERAHQLEVERAPGLRREERGLGETLLGWGARGARQPLRRLLPLGG